MFDLTLYLGVRIERQMQRKRIPGTGLSDDIDLSYEGGVGFS